VSDQKFQVQTLINIEFIEQFIMPVAGPPFIHDLGFDLRDKIPAFAFNDVKEVFLPAWKVRIIVSDKAQDILIRLDRDPIEIGSRIGAFGVDILILILGVLSGLPSTKSLFLLR
jgi:hypothetical protein